MLQLIVLKYEHKIKRVHYAEYENLWIVFRELDIYFSSSLEEFMLETAAEKDDPLLLATLLYYSDYDKQWQKNISKIIEKIMEIKIKKISNAKEAFLYREFWYLIVFYKCPYLNGTIEEKIRHKLEEVKDEFKIKDDSASRAIRLFMDFMLTDSNDKFVSWCCKTPTMLEEITYKTNDRTVFRRTKNVIDDTSF